MDSLHFARMLKHQGLLARRHITKMYTRTQDRAYRTYSEIVPLRFDINRHRSRYGELPRMYFMHRQPPEGCSTTESVPDHIFVLWTGNNEMSQNRQEGLQSIRECNPNREIRLITPGGLKDYVLPEYPLHPAYEDLSLVHRSDYLRAYLMHHYGGGYSDIKRWKTSWEGAFQQIQNDPDMWIIGYRELGSDRVGGRDARLGRQTRTRYHQIAGAGAYICRPRTPFTGEWLREIERRLDYYREELAQHPGDQLGSNPGYPILWIEIGMDIQYPLELKYNKRVAFNEDLLPSLKNHR